MKAITINGYEYNNWTRELIYSGRDDAYYRNSTDPLTKQLYAALKNEESNFESPFFGMSANQLLDDIFFVCACLYEDTLLLNNDDYHLALNKYLGWIYKEPDEWYRMMPLHRDLTIYYCYVYVSVFSVQKDLPRKVGFFIEHAHTLMDIKYSWHDTYKKVPKITPRPILKSIFCQQLYRTNLRPNVSLDAVTHLAEYPSNNLQHFLTVDSIRMVLSRIRDAEECKAAIDIFQETQGLYTGADPKHLKSFFAELREECERNGKIEQAPTQEEPDKQLYIYNSEQEQLAQLQQQLTEKDAEISNLKKSINELTQREKKSSDNCTAKDATIAQLQQQNTEMATAIAEFKKKVKNLKNAENTTNKKHSSDDAEIQRLKKEVEELKKQLKTAGKDYVCQVVAEAIEGTDDMDKEERKEKYNEIKGLLEVDSVPKEAKNAIKALLKASKKKPTGSTTINNFNGNVGQVANNVEEQHITEKQ